MKETGELFQENVVFVDSCVSDEIFLLKLRLSNFTEEYMD